MASNDEDFDLDSFNIDDFGDEGSGGFDGAGPKKDRKPTAVLAGGFKEGIKSHFTDPSHQIGFLKQALPKGYSQAIDAVDQTITGARSLYDTAAREAAPVLKELKKNSKTFMPIAKSVLPKGLSDKLEAWAADVAQPSSTFDPEENEITMSLGSIFSAYQEAQQQRDTESEANQAARDYALSKQTGESVKQLINIQNSTGRLASYQDQVTSKFQQKSLELQYRHYFTTRKILDNAEKQLELSKVSYETLIKNTALPELVKVQNDEIAKDMLKKKFLGNVVDPMQKWFSGAGNKIITKARGDIKNFFTDLGAQVGSISEMAGMMDNDGMGPQESGRDMALDLAGATAGGAVGAKMSTYFAKRLASYSEKYPGIAKYGHVLTRLFNEAPERTNNFLKNRADDGTIVGSVAGYAKSALGTYSKDGTVQSSMADSLDQHQYFDLQTRKTITDIIPGWLSKIHKELVITRTGDLTTEEEMWDWDTGGFETKESMRVRFQKKIFKQDDLKRSKESIADIYDAIDKPEKMGTGANRYKLPGIIRTKLKKWIYKRVSDGDPVNMQMLVSPYAMANPKEFGGMDAKEMEKLQAFLKSEESGFKYDRKYDSEDLWNTESGELKGFLPGTVGPFGRQDKVTNVSARAASASRNQVSSKEDLLKYAERGSAELRLMESLGYLTRGSGSERVDEYSINNELFDNANMLGAVPAITRAHGGGVQLPQFFSQGTGAKPVRKHGKISGPGTSTSDDVPAMLSDGEYVVRAEAVKQPGVLSLLRYINSLGSKPGQAPGQLVGAGEQNMSGDMDALANTLVTNTQTTNELLTKLIEKVEDFHRFPILTFNLPDLPNFDMSKLDLKSINLSFAETGILKLFNGAKSFGKAAGTAAWQMGKWGGETAWAGLKGAGRMTGQAGQAILGGAKSIWAKGEGLYVRGKDKVAITLRELEIGSYIDVTTGRVIKTLQDITGEVVNGAGEVILSAEDYAKGIYYSRGKKVLAWVSGGWDKVKAFGKGTWSAMSLIPASLKSMGNFALDVLDAPDDIYVEGDDPWQPRLLARVFRERGYRTFTTKEVITRVSQLTVPVIDKTGNVIVSDEDLKRGLVDVEHKPIRGIMKKIRDGAVGAFHTGLAAAKKIATTAQDIMFGLLGGVKNFFTGGSWGLSLFSSTQTVVTRLEQIYHLLNYRLPGVWAATPADFGKRPTFASTANLPPETAKAMKDLATQTKTAAKEAVKLATGMKDSLKETEVGKQVSEKAKSMSDKIKVQVSGEVTEDDKNYKAWLEANAVVNDDDATPSEISKIFNKIKGIPGEHWKKLTEQLEERKALNDYYKRTAPFNPKRDDEEVPKGSAYLKRFGDFLGVTDKLQSIKDSFGIMGELEGTKLHETLSNPDNIKQEERDALLQSLQQTKKLVSANVANLTPEAKATIKKLTDKIDKKGSIKSVQAFIDYVKSLNLQGSDGFVGPMQQAPTAFQQLKAIAGERYKNNFLLNMFRGSPQATAEPGKAKPSDAPNPNARLTAEMEEMQANIQNAEHRPRSELEQLQTEVLIQQRYPDGVVPPERAAKLKTWLGVKWSGFKSLFSRKKKEPEEFVGPTQSKWSKFKSNFSQGFNNDMGKIGDAFKSAAGETYAAQQQAKKDEKSKANAFKQSQKDWDKQYWEVYTARQSGNLSKMAFDAWVEANPSPTDLVNKAKKDAELKVKADKLKHKENVKSTNAAFDTEQRNWEARYAKVQLDLTLGIRDKDSVNKWLEENPSPKSLRNEKLKKLSMKERIGRAMKNDYTDLDGDGDRDGSAKDQEEQREKKKNKSLLESIQEGWKKGREGSGPNLFSKEGMATIFSSATNLLGGVVKALGPLGSLLVTMKNVGVMGLVTGAKVVGGVARAASWVRAGGIAATAASAAGGLAAMGGAVWGGITAAAGLAATGIAAVVSSPVLLGIAIAGAVAYAGMSAYKYYTQENIPIAKFRMAQYGYEVDDEATVTKIMELEQRCQKIVRVSKGQQAQLGTGETAESFMKIFGIDTKDKDQVKRWIVWFVKRFKPVFLAHATMLYNMTGKTDVIGADKYLKSADKLTYLDAVHFRGEGSPYYVEEGPFPDDDEVDIANTSWFSDDVDDAYEDAVSMVKRFTKDTDEAYERSKNAKAQQKKEEKKEESFLDKAKNWGGKGVDVVKNAWSSVYNHDFTEQLRISATDRMTEAAGVAEGVGRFLNETKNALTHQTARGAWSKNKSPTLDMTIRNAAMAMGVDEGFLRTMAMIESGGDPKAFNSGSKAAGIYQFIPSTAAIPSYGLLGPGYDKRFDEEANVKAGAMHAQSNAKQLRKYFGRDVEPWELYAAHQQGAFGYYKLREAAAKGIDPATIRFSNGVTLRKQIDSNVGKGQKGMSAADFVEYWKNRYASYSLKANATNTAGNLPPTIAKPQATPATTPVVASTSKAPAAAPTPAAPPVSNQTVASKLTTPVTKPEAAGTGVMLASYSPTSTTTPAPSTPPKVEVKQAEVKPVEPPPVTPTPKAIEPDIALAKAKEKEVKAQAQMEATRQEATVSTATGIDGAVELLRSHLKVAESMDASLTTLCATMSRIEKLQMAMLTASAQPGTSEAAKPKPQKTNKLTVTDTRKPPVSVSRAT